VPETGLETCALRDVRDDHQPSDPAIDRHGVRRDLDIEQRPIAPPMPPGAGVFVHARVQGNVGPLRVTFLRGADVGHRHRQQRVPRIAVLPHGCVVDGQQL
jgi:hypothetical protein